MIDQDYTNEIKTSSGRPKLLLADDSPTIRKVVELTFADEGIDVTAVADAGAAMEQFVRTQPDIVLVDINLPGTPGYKICEMIKQDEATASIPVLLLVGSFEPFDQDEAERVGADGFLLKPFKSIRELVSRVQELLSQTSEQGVAEEVTSNDLVDMLSAESTSPGPTPPVSEVNDIDALYRQSFLNADTQEIDPAEDLLTDSGMDDELIVTESNPVLGEGSNSPVEEISYNPEPLHASDPFSSTVEELETIPARSERDLEASDIKPPEADSAGMAAAQAPVSGPYEPTEEFISLVVNMVVERLSGREIREVAREVVPRIAEKLIREALAEESKS